MREDSGSVRNLVIGMLLIAAPFGVAYLLTRDNPNSEVLLIVALFCIGLAVAFAIASGLQRAGVLAVRLSGRSPRDIMIVGLAALSILTPGRSRSPWRTSISCSAGPTHSHGCSPS